MTEELDFLLDDKPKNDDEIPEGITRGTLILIVGIVAVILVLGVQLFRQNQTQPEPGQRAPDFALISFDGELFTRDSLRGQIIILNFWASWCPPCHAEALDLQAIYEDYADDGVLLLGVNYLDIEENALGFIDQYGITYPNGPDIAERIANAYNFQAAPETFIIGRDGKITNLFIGQVNYETLATALDSILAEDEQ
ncbi:MAG: TlpA disulfide reductase family protein [Anaerolineae bacterium]|nr:TlpA disulfide reductase family protein [Anaerolineae bacterium]MDQ7034492.1 TlpA disulfide reductase family protein [Anaerolineae bacterium]